MLSPYRLADYVFGSIRDTDRVQFSTDGDVITLTGLAAAQTASTEGRSLGHIFAIQTSLDQAATADLDVRVTVNGRDLETVTIPSGSTVSERIEVPPVTYIRGEPIAAVVDAVGLGQPGTLTVSLETSPYTLQPRATERPQSRKERFTRSLSKASREPPAPVSGLLRARNGLSEEVARRPPREETPAGHEPDPIPPRYRGVELPPNRGPRT